jgi:hypothetical protein
MLMSLLSSVCSSHYMVASLLGGEPSTELEHRKLGVRGLRSRHSKCFRRLSRGIGTKVVCVIAALAARSIPAFRLDFCHGLTKELILRNAHCNLAFPETLEVPSRTRQSSLGLQLFQTKQNKNIKINLRVGKYRRPQNKFSIKLKHKNKHSDEDKLLMHTKKSKNYKKFKKLCKH